MGGYLVAAAATMAWAFLIWKAHRDTLQVDYDLAVARDTLARRQGLVQSAAAEAVTTDFQFARLERDACEEAGNRFVAGACAYTEKGCGELARLLPARFKKEDMTFVGGRCYDASQARRFCEDSKLDYIGPSFGKGPRCVFTPEYCKANCTQFDSATRTCKTTPTQRLFEGSDKQTFNTFAVGKNMTRGAMGFLGKCPS